MKTVGDQKRCRTGRMVLFASDSMVVAWEDGFVGCVSEEDIDCVAKLETDLTLHEPASYTHLTLPTISSD